MKASGALLVFAAGIYATVTFADKTTQGLLRRDLLSNYAAPVETDETPLCVESIATINTTATGDAVLVLSECLDTKAMDDINTWVASVLNGFTDVTFTTTMIPGDCGPQSAPPIVDTGGLSGVNLISEEKALSNAARLKSFEQFGRVLEGLNQIEEPTNDAETVVISFVTDKESLEEVRGYETRNNYFKSFTFQLCGDEFNSDCTDPYDNVIQLNNANLYTYQPFTKEKTLTCEGQLDGAVPIVYLDDYSHRQCYCKCPAGSEINLALKKCEEPPMILAAYQCEWVKKSGCRHEITSYTSKPLQNAVTDWKLDVPYIGDGFTAKEGNNPRVDFIASQVNDPVYEYDEMASLLNYASSWPTKCHSISGINTVTPYQGQQDPEVLASQTIPWKTYKSGGKSYLDKLQFPGCGKYKLEVNAHDCHSDSTCPGCVAIVDMVRPHHTSECPVSFCDADPYGDSYNSVCDGTASLTLDNLEKARENIVAFYNFGELAEDDDYGESDRCDNQVFVMQNFFEDELTTPVDSYGHPSYEAGKKCFDTDSVLSDLFENDKTKQNPLVDDDNNCRSDDEPVLPGQCKRCCGMATELRELWVNYQCGYDYATRQCSGDESETCSVQQCLVVDGESLATATAKIKDDVAAESTAVLAHIDQLGFNAITQVHRALNCTDFDSEDPSCTFEAALSELIEVDAQLNWDLSYADVNDYVYWRYRVRGDEDWHLWQTERSNQVVVEGESTEQSITFDRPETMITIEAWTQCGKVHSFVFYVHLHLDSDIRVCDHFSQMWYQSTVSLTEADDTICAYPGSDFAELTFDYHANIGLMYDRNHLYMNISHVSCVGQIGDLEPTTFIDVPADNADVLKRFGVELVNRWTTRQTTIFSATCTFTYVGFQQDPKSISCERKFNIKDCVGPTYDTDGRKCKYTGCAGQHEQAGLYEACGGKIVRSSPDRTYVQYGDKECCQGCERGPAVECVSLLNLPDGSNDLKRCEPVQMDADAYTLYDDDYYFNDDEEAYSGSYDVYAGVGYGGYGNEPTYGDEKMGYGDEPTYNDGEQQTAAINADPFVLMSASSQYSQSGMALLLSAGVVVAVVALVVVKRAKAAAVQREREQSDVYEPLLL